MEARQPRFTMPDRIVRFTSTSSSTAAHGDAPALCVHAAAHLEGSTPRPSEPRHICHTSSRRVGGNEQRVFAERGISRPESRHSLDAIPQARARVRRRPWTALQRAPQAHQRRISA
eukprot:scaffold254866_cov31-Tisochrysis_lutea.AAC.1